MRKNNEKEEYWKKAIQKLKGKRRFYRKIGKVMIKVSKNELLK